MFCHGIYLHNRTGKLVKTVSDDGHWVYHYAIDFDPHPSGTVIKTFRATHTFVRCCCPPSQPNPKGNSNAR